MSNKNIYQKVSNQKILTFWHSDTKKIFLIDQLLFCLQKYNIKKSDYILVNMKEVLINSKISKIKNLKNISSS